MYTNISGGPTKVTLKLQVCKASFCNLLSFFSSCQQGEIYMWRKPVKPEGSFALAFMSHQYIGGPTQVSVKLQVWSYNVFEYI